MSEFETVIRIEAGETTCASAPGKWCRFFGTKNFGQKPVCMFFYDDDGNHQTLYAENGWTMRTKQCLETFKPVPDAER